jgi:hypothetical protein
MAADICSTHQRHGFSYIYSSAHVMHSCCQIRCLQQQLQSHNSYYMPAGKAGQAMAGSHAPTCLFFSPPIAPIEISSPYAQGASAMQYVWGNE